MPAPTDAIPAHVIRDAATLRLRSDVGRKRFFGLAPQDKSGSAVGSGIFQPDAHRLTYQHLQALARQQKAPGWSTLVDAAFLKCADRAAFHALVAAVGAEFFILAPQASLAVLDRRMTWIEALDAQESDHLLALEPR